MSTDIEQQIKKLEEWFQERPPWVRHAVASLISGTEPKLEELVGLAKVEAGIAVPAAVALKAFSLPRNLAHAGASSTTLRLEAIEQIQGINALAPKNPLAFGLGNLTIVYGDNGTGKSGYVRLLKHACGARDLGILHPNIRRTGASTPCATFRYTVNTKAEHRVWKLGDQPAPPLSSIEIYDTDCGDIYATEDHALIYEPPLLQFFGRLVSIAEQMDGALTREAAAARPKKLSIPPEYLSTAAATWYQGITHATKPEEIAARTDWLPTDEETLRTLTERLAADPRKQAGVLRSQKRQLEEALRALTLLAQHVSPDAVRTYWRLKQDAVEKRKIATASVTTLFQGLPFEISSAAWRRLWEAAREYSEETAYPGRPYPHIAEDAHCALCQQNLSADARERFQSFDAYIKGRVEGDATTAERLVTDFRNCLTSELPQLTSETLTALLMAGGITDQLEQDPLLSLATHLLERKRALLSEELTPEPGATTLDISALAFLNERGRLLEEKALVFDDDAAKENRNDLKSACAELEARKWLHGSKGLIEAERLGLVLNNALEEARRQTSTRGFTEQKKALAEVLVSDAYIARFAKEMKALHASRIDVEMVKGNPRKGVVPHEIRIRGAATDVPTAEILSEGERRIVSIAAFLADVTGPADKTPFIFDDPISSLDQAFEDATVRRLAQLAGERQVIVFTHRLSLVRLLSVAAEELGVEAHVLSVERTPDGCGNPEEAPITAKKARARVNELIQDVQRARKVLANEGQRSYDAAAQVVCTRLRKTLELTVEQVLLRDVVRRYVKDIQTKGKLAQLARLVPADCRFIDDLMTKYSGDEHEQPIETPKPLPPADELEADLKTLQAWMEEFEKRPNPW